MIIRATYDPRWGGQTSLGALQTNRVPRSPSHTLLQSSDWLASPLSLFICLFLGGGADLAGGGSSITNVRGEDSEEAAVGSLNQLVSVQMKDLVSLNVL